MRNDTGFTLIEVLAAMLVLSIGILALAPMMTLSVTTNTLSSQITQIAQTAQARMEAKVAQGSFGPLPLVEREILNGGLYAVTTEVRDHGLDAAIPSSVYQIDVTVSWTDRSNVARTMKYSTYTAK